MILLRMLAFTPLEVSAGIEQTGTENSGTAEKKSPELGKSAPPEPVRNEKKSQINELLSSIQGKENASTSAIAKPEPEPQQDSDVIDFGEGVSPQRKESLQPVESPQRADIPQPIEKVQAEPALPSTQEKERSQIAPEPEVEATPLASPKREVTPARVLAPGEVLPLNGENWVDILRGLNLSGVTQSVASNCAMTSWKDDACTLMLNEGQSSLSNKNHEQRIEKALSDYYGKAIKLSFELGKTTAQTPAEIESDRREQARLEAVKIIQDDANVQKLIESFDGTLITESIEARQTNGT